jgi:hypothetical protein
MRRAGAAGGRGGRARNLLDRAGLGRASSLLAGTTGPETWRRCTMIMNPDRSGVVIGAFLGLTTA